MHPQHDPCSVIHNATSAQAANDFCSDLAGRPSLRGRHCTRATLFVAEHDDPPFVCLAALAWVGLVAIGLITAAFVSWMR
jgi:hypothetical protein